MKKVPLTIKGAEKLRAELEELKSVVRPRIIASIATARAHGDLKEMPNITLQRSNKVLLKGVLPRSKVSSLMHKLLILPRSMPTAKWCLVRP